MTSLVSFSLQILIHENLRVEASIHNKALQITLENVSVSDVFSWFPDYTDCGLSLGDTKQSVILEVQANDLHIKFYPPVDSGKPGTTLIDLRLSKQWINNTRVNAAALCLDSATAGDLSQISVLGSFLPENTVSLRRVVVAYTSDSYPLPANSPTNSFLSDAYDILDQPNALPRGATLGAELEIDGQVIHLHTPTASQASPPSGTPVAFSGVPSESDAISPSASASSTNDANAAPVQWVSLQRSVGPIHINRVGGRWLGGTDGAVQGLLDAGLLTSAFSINFSGLAISIPLFRYDQITAYRVDLSGLDVSFSSPTISVQGGLIYYKDSSGFDTYGGSLAVQAPSLSLIATAEFQESAGVYSLFAFAKLQRPLGGPPAFKVKALSLGIGYNRSIIPPTIKEVQSFPLLALNEGNVQTAFQEFSRISPHAEGSYWIAAGIEFSSFEHIQSKVIAILEAGKGSEILILGQSYGTFPASAADGSGKAYGFVELDIEVVLEPAKGLFKAEALLSSNSYVLDPNCHLTGGFAFYSWFGSNPHSGDFILTIGGYSPLFSTPAHYPTVPRLGFNWNVSDQVQIKGSAYLAITPSCVMAGGSLEVLFHDGNLCAWLTAYADFLMNWEPFAFVVDVGITIGISYAVHFWFINTTLRFELGATLNLYGPPVGGVVHIHLWVISFSITFGAPPSSPPAISYQKFLQLISKGVDNNNSSSDICTITIVSGLIREAVDSTSNKKVWVVRAGSVCFDVTTAIPVLELQLNDEMKNINQKIWARPMKPIEGDGQLLSSSFRITFRKSDDPQKVVDVSADDYLRNLPAALWEDTQSIIPVLASAKLIGATVGKKGIKPKNQSILGTFMTDSLDAKNVFRPTTIGTSNPTLPIDSTAGIAAVPPTYLFTDEGLIASIVNTTLQETTRLILKDFFAGLSNLQAPLGVGT